MAELEVRAYSEKEKNEKKLNYFYYLRMKQIKMQLLKLEQVLGFRSKFVCFRFI